MPLALSILELLERLLAFFLGIWIVLIVIISATRTFVLPRSARDPVTRRVFVAVRMIFDLFVNRATSYEQRDHLMAMYAPISLLLLPVVWLWLVMFGYMLMFWATGVDWITAFHVSGSSLLTLGFEAVHRNSHFVLVFSEAIIGLTLVALLIAYLPTIYSAFSKRESLVSLLEVRAGSPPSAIEMFKRFKRIGRLDEMSDIWQSWESWFTELDETHTSLAVLSYFRSPVGDRSWITAAGAILDAASLYQSALEMPPNPKAALCIRAGFIALRHIADFFQIPHNPDPKPDDMISVTRYEFDEALNELQAAGIPIKADRDQAWKDYSGWRVNYDQVLLGLCGLLMPPYAPWSSDRSMRRSMKPTLKNIFSARRLKPERIVQSSLEAPGAATLTSGALAYKSEVIDDQINNRQ
ncbi:MAG: hypothetical protein U0528_00255 [Anaerolineae bacterium]